MADEFEIRGVQSVGVLRRLGEYNTLMVAPLVGQTEVVYQSVNDICLLLDSMAVVALAKEQEFIGRDDVPKVGYKFLSERCDLS